MQDATITAPTDADYAKLFDVETEARGMGNSVDMDFNPAMAELLERGPVLAGTLRSLLGLPGQPLYDTDLPTYTALSFAACDRALRENEVFTSYVYDDMPAVRKLGNVLLNKVGDPHKRLRATAQPLFIKPAATGWWKRNWIDQAVATLLDRIADRDQVDLNVEVCARVPLQVVSRGVGLEGEEALRFREQLLISIGHRDVTREAMQAAGEAVEATLRRVIDDRRQSSGDDIVSTLIAADFKEADGSVRKLTDAEVLGFSRHILLAGGGTTWRQLGITLHALLERPDYWAAARADRAIIADAIEESTRWNATGPVFPRLVLKDTMLEGVLIPANSRVDVALGAANRDPTRWDNPHAFDPFRKRQVHLGFGMGPHLCLGQHVARELMSTVINGLMDRFPNIRLDPEAPAARLTGGLEQRGMSAIPVRLD